MDEKRLQQFEKMLAAVQKEYENIVWKDFIRATGSFYSCIDNNELYFFSCGKVFYKQLEF